MTSTLWNLVALAALSMTIDFSSAQHTPFTPIDSIIHNFALDESRLWDLIQSHANTTETNAREKSLTEITNFFTAQMKFNYGKIDTVQPFNWHLAQYIEQLNRTQVTASRYLLEEKDELRRFAEKAPLTIQQIIGQIFDETKRLPFLAYIRESSDYCHSSNRNSHLEAYNMVTDFYTTIVEALLKGYMVSQMSYMILAVNGPRKHH